MKIPMLDLVRQYNSIKPEIDQAIEKVLTSGSYINGPAVQEFESNMAEFLGVKHAIGVASGSDALLLSLHALGIGFRDKVIVPSFTFFATAGAVERLGATPVFVDIDPMSYNLDLYQVEELLSQDPLIRAIIPVHLFGWPCDMQCLMRMAEKYNVYIVEDACQAINATYFYPEEKNHENNSESFINLQRNSASKSVSKAKAGTIGHTGCFSFFPSKNLSCYGDGGMVVTNDDGLANRIKVLRQHGAEPKYFHKMVGYNSRLDTLQAAILNVKLKHLRGWTRRRQEIAHIYKEEIERQELHEWVIHPPEVKGHVYHQYVIEVDNRNACQDFLAEKGISTAVYYPLPLHLQQCFMELGYRKGQVPVAERASQHVLALPIDPELTEEQIKYVVKQMAVFISKH